jgi:hypothetical protein
MIRAAIARLRQHRVGLCVEGLKVLALAARGKSAK